MNAIPAVRLAPKDVEVIDLFLQSRINGVHIDNCLVVQQNEFYNTHPVAIPPPPPHVYRDPLDLWFYVVRPIQGQRVNRTVADASGRWIGQRKLRIMVGDVTVGWKQRFLFKNNQNLRTGWHCVEYTVDVAPSEQPLCVVNLVYQENEDEVQQQHNQQFILDQQQHNQQFMLHQQPQQHLMDHNQPFMLPQQQQQHQNHIVQYQQFMMHQQFMLDQQQHNQQFMLHQQPQQHLMDHNQPFMLPQQQQQHQNHIVQYQPQQNLMDHNQPFMLPQQQQQHQNPLLQAAEAILMAEDEVQHEEGMANMYQQFHDIING